MWQVNVPVPWILWVTNPHWFDQWNNTTPWNMFFVDSSFESVSSRHLIKKYPLSWEFLNCCLGGWPPPKRLENCIHQPLRIQVCSQDNLQTEVSVSGSRSRIQKSLQNRPVGKYINIFVHINNPIQVLQVVTSFEPNVGLFGANRDLQLGNHFRSLWRSWSMRFQVT